MSAGIYYRLAYMNVTRLSKNLKLSLAPDRVALISELLLSLLLSFFLSFFLSFSRVNNVHVFFARNMDLKVLQPKRTGMKSLISMPQRIRV